MHCFRRAASRLITSTASAPARSSWMIASHSSRTTLLPRLPQPLSQYRWNSNEASTPKQDAAEEQNISNEQLIEAAAQHVEQGATRTDDIAAEVAAAFSQEQNSHAQKPRHAQEPGYATQLPHGEAKRRKRQIILAQAPEPKETVFIGNLFYDVTAEDLRKQMEKYGIVERLHIVFDNRGISRGFGYVQYDTIDAARRALEAMDGRIFEGRYCRVQFANNNIDRQKALKPASRCLYIGNLAFEMTDRDLNEIFKDITNVIDVRVSVDRRTGQPRGFAHADFTNVESARQAMEILSKKAPYGRKLMIDFSHYTKKGPSKDKQPQNKQPQEE